MTTNDNLSAHNAIDYDIEILRTIPYYNLFHEETLSLITTIKPQVKVWLDTGSGTGNLVEKAMNKFPDCKFYLSDPSKSMLMICKDKFRGKPVELLGEYETVQIENKIQPEIITAIQCHHYLDFKSRIATTNHCFDLLSEGGIYITFENIKPESIEGTEIGLRRWSEYQQKQGKSEGDIKIHLSRFDTHFYPIKVSEHIDIMKNAGFKTVELFWMSNMQAGFYGIK